MEEIDVIGHDTSTDEKYRLYASLSFAVLLLGVGVPLWWYTTAVPRVPLPYSGIARLSDLDMRISTRIIVATFARENGELLADEVRAFFADAEVLKVDVDHQVISSNLVSRAYTTHDLEKVAATFDLKVGELLLLEAANLKEDILVGSRRTIYFSKTSGGAELVQILSQWILRDKSLALTKNALAEPTLYSLDEENRRRFPASAAYDVLLTLVNPDPESLKIDWNLPRVIDEYIEPFLEGLSLIANFSIKSQWLYLLPLDVTPKQVPDSSPLGRHYALPENVLPQLVTPLEKKLASQVSLHPCINLVVYTVPCDKAPLHIYTRTGHRSKSASNVEAFLSPRWGGVVISNPPLEVCEEAITKNKETVVVMPEGGTIMGVFLAQLRLLLGIPDANPIKGAALVQLENSKPRDWEFDALLRIRTIEQLTSAKLTLQSLSQLLKEISSIVITETVGNRIKSALDLVERSAELLERGHLVQGFLLSKEAFVTAEAAFTDPSLLALLYFPEDQKYAVYVPLFLPIMIPVLLSLKNIYRYFFEKKVNGDMGKEEETLVEDSEKIKKNEENVKLKTG
ncbi:GPI transamidase component PIG-S isoform X1 [Cephus cinctus]|uniref:GPI transamidase component PIG-S isoform X1 n=1 Tax=Cephus cinctus TaxID=211228 RepID=A0AAJ7FHE9_CEPCN|nr:GPI transamidase component PIG-S isoform X1 [Cephus cinctus]